MPLDVVLQHFKQAKVKQFFQDFDFHELCIKPVYIRRFATFFFPRFISVMAQHVNVNKRNGSWRRIFKFALFGSFSFWTLFCMFDIIKRLSCARNQWQILIFMLAVMIVVLCASFLSGFYGKSSVNLGDFEIALQF